MSTATRTTRDALADQLEAAGYIVGPPPHSHPDAIDIDRESATEGDLRPVRTPRA